MWRCAKVQMLLYSYPVSLADISWSSLQVAACRCCILASIALGECNMVLSCLYSFKMFVDISYFRSIAYAQRFNYISKSFFYNNWERSIRFWSESFWSFDLSSVLNFHTRIIYITKSIFFVMINYLPQQLEV